MHPRLFFVRKASQAATMAFVSCQRDQEDKRARERVEWDTYLVENIPHALMSECRTLDVFDRTEFTRKMFSFPRGNRFLLLSLEYLHYLRVITQVDLGANDKQWNARTVVVHFGKPPLLHVVERHG